tara:strand:- start:3770 stop:4642 length:873 start_codon:yes stop_codon:yes gene_type:complete
MFDFDVIDSNTILGESGFYLYKTNEIVFLDLLKPSIFFYSIRNRKLIQHKLDLPKPLGNVYPHNNGLFIISAFDGLYIFNRKTKKVKKFTDIRKNNELKNISYNDGLISDKKLWIGLSHLKENKNLGYFGYLFKKEFIVIDSGFKVSNGPALDKLKKNLYFSDSLNSRILTYNLKTNKKNILIKYKKNQGIPDGIALDNKNGLWVAHWSGAKITRIDLKTRKIDKEIKLPAYNITSITFFGKELNYLFITSAKFGTSKILEKKYKYSGQSLIIKTNYKGLKIPYSNYKLF